LPDSFQKYLEEDIKFMKSNITENYTGFTKVEVERLERVLSSMKQYKLFGDELANAKSDFAAFFIEHDRRRKTNFNLVFPEYVEFINECKNI
jgi:thiaminase